jgi:hypothetical protein
MAPRRTARRLRPERRGEPLACALRGLGRPGRQSHSDTALCISSAIPHTEHTGGASE